MAGKTGGSVSSWCHTFDNNLKFGDSTSEVADLVLVLNKESLLSGKTDNFNEEVAAAVVKLQARYGIIQTGYFGPLTRGKINSIHRCKTAVWASITSPTRTDSLTPTIYGTAKALSQVAVVLKSSSGDKAYGSGNVAVTNGKWSVTVSPAIWPGLYSVYVYDANSRLLTSGKLEISKVNPISIRLESPNGGESLNVGNNYTISWQSPVSQTVDIYLVRNLSGCFNLKSGMACLSVVDPMFKIATVVSGSNYVWRVGDYTSVAYGSSVEKGQYYMKICLTTPGYGASPEFSNSKQECDTSDDLFSITSGPSTDASVTVLAPNGGQTWTKGTSQMIKWRDNVLKDCYVGNSTCTGETRTYDIQLVPYNPPCSGEVCKMMGMPYAMPYTIARSVEGAAYDASYSWRVGQVADIDAEIPDGAYMVRVCRNNRSDDCDSSDSYFKISGSSTTNKPPVIDGLTAPSALAIGEEGKWLVKAHDPESGSLSYGVDWGDSVYASPSSGAAYMPYAEQTSTFTHSYSYPGTYKVTFRVKDSSGLSAETSATVRVSSMTVYPAGTSSVDQ